VFAGRPQDLEDYEEIDYDGLKVFLAQDFSSAQEVRLMTKGRAPWQRLIVEVAQDRNKKEAM